ncbi:MAG: hypothetical protein ACWGQW_02100, partial [bacterium]
MGFIHTYGKPPRKAIKTMLDEALSIPSQRHSINPLHASDLTSGTSGHYLSPEFCPREFRLLDLTKKKRKPLYLSPSLHYTFDQGNYIEDLVRNKYLRANAYGDWKCKSCNISLISNGPPGTCAKPCSCRWEYKGLRFVNMVYGVTCGIDLVLNTLSPAGMQIVEIKSIKDADFKTLQAPLSEHKIRTLLYMRLYREENPPGHPLINTKEGVILYVSKGFGHKQADGKMSPFKEFRIPSNDKLIQSYLKKARILTL